MLGSPPLRSGSGTDISEGPDRRDRRSTSNQPATSTPTCVCHPRTESRDDHAVRPDRDRCRYGRGVGGQQVRRAGGRTSTTRPASRNLSQNQINRQFTIHAHAQRGPGPSTPRRLTSIPSNSTSDRSANGGGGSTGRRGGVPGGEAAAGPEGDADQGNQRGHLYERSDDAGQGSHTRQRVPERVRRCWTHRVSQ